MHRHLPDWWDDWIDMKTPLGKPLRLKKGAPEDVQKEFEEYMRIEDEYRAMWNSSAPCVEKTKEKITEEELDDIMEFAHWSDTTRTPIIGGPFRLSEDAPEEVKKKFKEWQIKLAEKGITL